MQAEVLEGFLEVRDIRLCVAHANELPLDEVDGELQLLRVRENQGPKCGQIDLKGSAGNLDQILVELHPNLAIVILALIHTPEADEKIS
jgi:hypothetical protein